MDILSRLQSDERGNIVFWPMAGYSSFTPGGVICAVAIGFYRSQEAIARQDFELVQVGMTPTQARELGLALLRIADKVEAPDSSPKN